VRLIEVVTNQIPVSANIPLNDFQRLSCILSLCGTVLAADTAAQLDKLI
jgi:hypothetical protein